MSDISFLEQPQLEKLFDMGGGWALDFNDRTMAEFVAGVVGRNIRDAKYAAGSGSKAQRLRAFWRIEPNHVVAKLTSAMIDRAAHHASERGSELDAKLVDACRSVAARLAQGAPVEDMDALASDVVGSDLDRLASAVRRAIDEDRLDEGLDRLHTFTVKFVRKVAERRGVQVPRDKPLHSIFGEYVKALKAAGLLEAPMTERILKSSISTLEAFNEVRNERSLAHDNALLNHDESLLIFSHTIASLRFLQSIEERGRTPSADAGNADPADAPW